MPIVYTIHKPTHKFFGNRTRPMALGQMRGDTLILNRIATDGTVCEKSWAVGTCAYHLTNYGYGFTSDDTWAVERMGRAWHYVFGDAPAPTRCEKIQERV